MHSWGRPSRLAQSVSRAGCWLFPPSLKWLLSAPRTRPTSTAGSNIRTPRMATHTQLPDSEIWFREIWFTAKDYRPHGRRGFRAQMPYLTALHTDPSRVARQMHRTGSNASLSDSQIASIVFVMTATHPRAPYSLVPLDVQVPTSCSTHSRHSFRRLLLYYRCRDRTKPRGQIINEQGW